MGLILSVIGGVAGWRSGGVYASAYAIFAVVAIFAAGLSVLLQSRGSTALLTDPITMLSGWLVAFLYLAIPYTMLAWLKAKRIENRGE